MANNSKASKQEMGMDWQIDKSILDCNKYLLQHKMNCDVKFKVGEDQEIIEAHKFILSTRSPVFERMFNGSFKESDIDPVIPDVKAAAFKALLRNCYYECLDIEGEVALSLLYAATKYMLPILEQAARKTLIGKLDLSKIWDVCMYSTEVGDDELHAGCIAYFKRHLSSSNLCDVFEYAVTTGHKELQGYCRNHLKDKLSETNILGLTRYVAKIQDEDLHATCRSYMKDHLSGPNVWEVYTYALDEGDTEVLHLCREYFEGSVSNVKEALQSKDFPHIKYEVLLDIMHINDKVDIESDSGFNPGISISEIELFKACNRWAEEECARQKIEGDGSNKGKVLGECLSLIPFPTMLQNDLLTVVYSEGILTQAGIVNLGRYMDRELGSHCRVDFPSRRSQFTVTPFESESATSKRSTLYIESEGRVLLTRVWRESKGSYTVTVREESTKRSWSMSYDTKHSNHVTGKSDNVLHYIDIEPQVLEAGTRYSVQYITLKEQRSGYKGVKVSRDVTTSYTNYALRLSLI